jgi:molybdenum cofactor synthesis domain-containing protein
MLSPEEAWRLIDAHVSPLPTELLGRRGALGRVLARPLAARVDVPAADVSAMDGYAVRGDVAPGETRPVAGTLAAGAPPGFELPAGAALRIMTGAPIPAAADRVIPVELTQDAAADRGMSARPDAGAMTPDRVTFRAGVAPGEHLRRRGEILREGAPLLATGAVLTPGALALLAAHGYGELPVHRAPRVAILATGDEVVPPDQEPDRGQLRDSHTDFLLAAGSTLGLPFEPLGIAPDREEALAALVDRGLAADVLLLCGGVSMGEFDLAEGVLAKLGCRLLFDSVAIQPGKPVVFGVHVPRPGAAAGLVFGLPGNPASVMVAFWLFVRPALRRLLGFEDAFWRDALTGTLAARLPAGPPSRDRFMPAQVDPGAPLPRVTPFPPKGSHDLAAFGRGNALLRIAAGAPARSPGESCEVLILGGA